MKNPASTNNERFQGVQLTIFYQHRRTAVLIDLSLTICNDNPFLKEEMSVAKLGHTGTHLDVMNAEPFDTERFISRGKLFNVSNIRERQIEPSDFINDANEGDFVIFRTGWLKDTYGTDAYFRNHPELSQATIEQLVKQKVNLIGIDFPGARRVKNTGQLIYTAPSTTSSS